METKKHLVESGTKGGGNFYRITIRPKSEFILFRNHDVGKAGHIERVAGKRKNGSWNTQCWLVNKKDAKVEGNCLVGKINDVKKLFSKFHTPPKHIEGDEFQAKSKESTKKQGGVQSKKTKDKKDSCKNGGIKVKNEKYKQKKKDTRYEDEDPLLIQ